MDYLITIDDGSRYLVHHGIKGQKWGVRRFQNEDGSLTPAGVKRYRKGTGNSKLVDERIQRYIDYGNKYALEKYEKQLERIPEQHRKAYEERSGSLKSMPKNYVTGASTIKKIYDDNERRIEDLNNLPNINDKQRVALEYIEKQNRSIEKIIKESTTKKALDYSHKHEESTDLDKIAYLASRELMDDVLRKLDNYSSKYSYYSYNKYSKGLSDFNNKFEVADNDEDIGKLYVEHYNNYIKNFKLGYHNKDEDAVLKKILNLSVDDNEDEKSTVKINNDSKNIKNILDLNNFSTTLLKKKYVGSASAGQIYKYKKVNYAYSKCANDGLKAYLKMKNDNRITNEKSNKDEWNNLKFLFTEDKDSIGYFTVAQLVYAGMDKQNIKDLFSVLKSRESTSDDWSLSRNFIDRPDDKYGGRYEYNSFTSRMTYAADTVENLDKYIDYVKSELNNSSVPEYSPVIYNYDNSFDQSRVSDNKLEDRFGSTFK